MHRSFSIISCLLFRNIYKSSLLIIGSSPECGTFTTEKSIFRAQDLIGHKLPWFFCSRDDILELIGVVKQNLRFIGICMITFTIITGIASTIFLVTVTIIPKTFSTKYQNSTFFLDFYPGSAFPVIKTPIISKIALTRLWILIDNRPLIPHTPDKFTIVEQSCGINLFS